MKVTGIGIVTAALLAATPWGVAPAYAAEPEVVSQTNFDDGTYADWQQSGGPTLSTVEADGGLALLVTGRANDFDGIQTAPGLLSGLAPGEDYTLTMRVRLAEGTPEASSVRFVVKPSYTWVGNTAVTADAWASVTGTYSVPMDADTASLQIYIGTADLTAGTPYSYLLDDITIAGTGAGVPAEPDPTDPGPTEPDPDFVPGGAVNPMITPVDAAQGAGNVSALTFDDGPNGATTEALLDFLGANDIHATFCVIGQNIEAPGGAATLRRIVAEGHTLCNHSTSYADMGSMSPAAVEDDLTANLAIIRNALGDPNAVVPFFRAPNGSWGQTREVAVALGMQPLTVTNTIGDWETQDVPTLTDRLRTSMKAGQIVLTHDGGGDRAGTLAAIKTVVSERLAAGWTFTLPVGAAAAVPVPAGALEFDFEDGLQGWVPRSDAAGEPTVVATTTEAHGGTQAAMVSDRSSQGSGIARDMTDAFTAGTTYEVSAWVKFATGQESDAIWLSLARTTAGATSYDTLGQFTGVSSEQWTQVSTTFQATDAESALLYFETNYNGTNTSDFLVDDVVIRAQTPSEIQDLLPIKDTVDFPVGVAIDSRETSGGAAELTAKHFDQLTSENYMKPEAWYDADQNFRPHPEVDTLMTFAQDNDLHVYGHTLVWHSQTPSWFFENADGSALTDSPADQQILKDRMRAHIFAVAGSLSDNYGAFGSDSNPLYAFDVVNEVVADGGENADGLRRSEWYRILGEQFIDLAFQYANEAFNGEFAAEGAAHPVTLFINDYNTEQAGKQQRLHALLERMHERGVPVDGVGHQFHLSLATPVEALEGALTAFSDLDVVQAVTELDVTTGTPETEAGFIEQGYYYRDAFRIFRAHADDLFSVTVWALTDGRSWRADSGGPLVFDDSLQAKPAYYGIVDGELPARLQTANVFAGDVALDAGATTAPDWDRLPLNLIEDTAGFQLRWAPDHLTVYISVEDATDDATDGVEFAYGDQVVRLGRDGDGDVDGVVTEAEGGYSLVAHLPLAEPAEEGDTIAFDARMIDGEQTSAWNTLGAMGTLTLIEELSYLEVPESGSAPVVDAESDDAWALAGSVTTLRQVEGTAGASAVMRTLWNGSTLYVLAEVTDANVDVSGSDPWTQDSVEIFLDAGNHKNGSYRYDDTQIRISAANAVSFGTGDEAFQLGRVESATRIVDGGYVVEAAISLLEEGGLGTFHGVDFQVNDATAGARTAIRTWADPSGTGYQSTARWGVGQLVGAPADNGGEPGTPAPGTPAPGGTDPDATTPGGTAPGGSGADADGRPGGLAATGADAFGLGLLGLLFAGLGTMFLATRARRRTSVHIG